MSFYPFFQEVFYSSLWRAGSRNRDSEWYSFLEYRCPSLSTRTSFSREKSKMETVNCWRSLSLFLSRDYITVILISIVNTRTKLTLAWKVRRMRKELGSRVEEKLIELVIDGRGYRPFPLSHNFKMSWKWNVMLAYGTLEHLDGSLKNNEIAKKCYLMK